MTNAEFDLLGLIEWTRQMRERELAALRREGESLKRILRAVKAMQSATVATPARQSPVIVNRLHESLENKLLRSLNGHPVSFNELKTVFSNRSEQIVANALTSLCRKNLITRISRGMYQRNDLTAQEA